MSNRENYDKLKLDLKDGFDVHRIDWNSGNNDTSNLVIIPRKVRELIHGYLGYTTLEEIDILVRKFNSNKSYRKASIVYLNSKLSKHVDTEKECRLGLKCKKRLGKLAPVRPKNTNTQYRKRYINEHGPIKEDWEVHHLDWEHDNNELDNLKAIPTKLHILIHDHWGYVTKEEIDRILEVWDNYSANASCNYLEYHLKQYIDTEKTCSLGNKCRSLIGVGEYEQYVERRQYMPRKKKKL